MKSKRKFIILLIMVVLYLFGYAACRLGNELIHRRTWSGGWNRHWVVAATPVPRIRPMPYAGLHIPGDDEYNAAMEKFKAEYKAIRIRRKAYGIAFFPMRCAESVIWWIIFPKDTADQ